MKEQRQNLVKRAICLLLSALYIGSFTVRADDLVLPDPPTPPYKASDVSYIFSSTYGNVLISGFSGKEKVTTAGGKSVVKVESNGFLRMAMSQAKDLSTYTHLHVDVYYVTVAKSGYYPAIQIKSSTGHSMKVDNPLNQWVSYDIPLSDFTGVDLTKVNYFEIRGSGNDEFYADNAYFYNKLTWQGTTDTTWDEPSNWDENRAPTSISNIIIPNTATYPTVGSSSTCSTLTFEPGAELGGQNNLTVRNGTTVKTKLTTNRWYMLSMPMNVTSLHNFYFAGDPRAWFKKFDVINDAADWTYITDVDNTSYPAGKGFSYFVDNVSTKGTITNKDITLAGSLIKTKVDTELDFGGDMESYFALAGNPFMTTIDFNTLQKYEGQNTIGGNINNASIITDNYLVWTASGFVGYPGVGGSFGPVDNFSVPTDANNRKIPPLQAIIVESVLGTPGTGTITFDVSAIQSTGTSTIGLRSANNTDSDKLNIVASNDKGAVLTFITNRAEGQSARKLKDEISKMPDVYTLAADNKTALGANIITTDNITVPLAIYSSYEGDITLTFTGMDSYNADIKLIDTANNNAETELNGESKTYTFAHTPRADKQAVEDRFFIAFSPQAITGTEQVVESNTLIYAKDNTIYVNGSSENRILQVFIYDIQGRTVHAETNLNTLAFTVNGLKPDVYFVKVITEKGVKNTKLIN